MWHTNYARWMPVFLRDMTRLHETHPDVYHEFNINKNLVAQRGAGKFSLMGLDQSQFVRGKRSKRPLR